MNDISVPVSVLLVEDSEEDAELTADELRRAGLAFELTRVDSRDGLSETLAHRSPDVILCNPNVPGLGAPEALELLNGRDRDVPFLILSDEIRQEQAVELLRRGARDCLSKSDISRLPLIVERELADAEARRGRRAAEQALREREQRFRELVANIPDVIVRIGLRPEPHFDYVSPAAQAVLGYTPEELYEQPELVLGIVHPDDRPLAERMLTEPDPAGFTMRVTHKHGDLIWLEQRHAGVVDEHGELVAIEAICRDVTDRFRAERLAEASENRLRLALEHARMLVWEHDLDTDELTLRGGEHEWAFGSQEPRTFPELVALVHPEDRQAVARFRERLTVHGFGEAELRLVRPDGSEVWVETRARAMPREAAKGILFGTTLDITTRKYAQDELSAAHGRLAAVIRASPVAISAVDLAGHATIWNPGAERLYGWTAREVIGRALPQVAPEQRESVRALMDTVFAGNTVAPFETTRRTKDGRYVDVMLAVAPLRDGKGEVSGALAMASDLSDQVWARRELESSYDSLRRVDAERRGLLERLVRAQEEERARIAADVHDDSAQVMTALALRLELLRSKVDEPELLASIGELERLARSSINRLRHLIFELRPPALDRDGLAGALRLYLEEMRQDRGVEFALENNIHQEPDPVARAILYRIAQEALLNVSKHARATHVEVVLQQEVDGIKVRVSDNGVGIARETREGDLPGHLGLVAMRERAEMTGGWWRISSEGTGTCVEFLVRTGAETTEANPP